MFNSTFYPTPKHLIGKMVAKINHDPKKILEPSAGKGDIVDYMIDSYHSRSYEYCDVSVIEVNKDLRATLRGKKYKVIDNDFLAYSAPDQYNLIIANPPFDSGDLHLLKAIDIMYRGEIIFLLNAETIRNPHTNTRKDLVKRLEELNADIEYIEGAFKDAERPTGVEVALIYIDIKRKVEDDLFEGCGDIAEEVAPEIEKEHEVSTGRTIEELVAEYCQIIKIGTETIMAYYRNYPKIGRYISFNKAPDRCGDDYDLTGKVQKQINKLLNNVRNDFWRRVLNLDEVRSRMTANKQSEFELKLQERCYMDFTESNIRQFVLNLIGGFEQDLVEAVIEIFDRFTIRHAWDENLYTDNIHYYNGWKTNNAFKVNKKVIIPIHKGYGGPFIGYKGWSLNWEAEAYLHDIDIVMSYFDGMPKYLSIGNALKAAFQIDQSRKIVSTYFSMNVYKKGTIHLTFNSEDVLRRFNVVACKGKGWLPGDYGAKPYKELSHEEKTTVDSFEGQKSYTKNLNQPLFAAKSLLKIAE